MKDLKVSIIHNLFRSQDVYKELEEKYYARTYRKNATTVNELKKRVEGFDVAILDPFIIEDPKVNEVFINSSVKHIIVSTVSYSFLDKELLESNGIKLYNCSGYASQSVAESAIGFAIILSHKLKPAILRSLKFGKRIDPVVEKSFVGKSLNNKTLGIIGVGAIGAEVAHLARGVGMDVLGYNRSFRDLRGVKNAELDYLVKNSDFIVVAMEGSEKRPLLPSKLTALVKPGATIINLNDRPESIFNMQVLVKRIKLGEISVSFEYINEPWYSEVVGLSNVVVTPIIGWFKEESLRNIDHMILNHIENIKKSL